jgi:glycosyltransferase involved in cell wall biosynthesis
MKLVYLLPGGLFNSGGMERVTSVKANYLTEHLGYEVSIVTTEQLGRPVFYPLSDKVRLFHLDIGIGKNFYTESYLQKVVSRFFKLREYRKRLTQVLNEIRPDITISTLGGLDIEFINDLKDGSIKIGELHFPGNFRQLMTQKLYRSFIPNWIGRVLTWNFKRKCRKLSRLVVLTEEEKSFWKNKRNMVVIPNPLPFDSNKIASTENKKAIAVGRLAYEKGFDLLIEVWKTVRAKHLDWELDIFGNGDQKEFLNQLIKANGLDSVIRINEPVQEIQNVYPDYSMLIFPTRYLDSFGMVIIEAMSCGLPSVAFNSPCGPKDLIEDNVTGFLVETGDVEGLSEKINYLIESDDVRKTMSKAALKASLNYRIDNIMNRWVHLFEILKNENNRSIGH